MYNIYFDYAATTPVDPGVLEIYRKNLENHWFNPSSTYAVDIHDKLETIKENILARLNPGIFFDLIYTSGATESINTVLKGTLFSQKNPEILISNIEHDAVEQTAKYLRQQNLATLKYIPADSKGIIEIDKLESLLTPSTCLVSIIAVQNELGTIQPLEELYKKIKSYSNQILIHIDAAQALGKISLDQFIPYGDFISLSGHKFYAPKGIGILLHNKKTPFGPLIHGGGQQNQLRSGTINFPLIEALNESINITINNFDSRLETVRKNRSYFMEIVSKHLKNIIINSQEDLSVPHIINISIPDTKGEIIKNILGQHQIYVSTSSACSSKKAKQNTLAKLNKPDKISESSLRISLSHLTTRQDIDKLVNILVLAKDLF